MIQRSPVAGLAWLPNYLKSFGVIEGARLFGRVARLDRAGSAEAVPVSVAGLGRVWMRAATRDHAIFQQVWVKREYDLARAAPRQFPPLRAAYEAAVAAGRRPLILDAGAHVGMSLLWWRRLFPEARIVAVEPSSANLAVLRKNVADHPDITVLHAAIAGAPGRLRVADPAAHGAAIRFSPDGQGEEVAALTVAQILEEVGADEILLAKIDIEGGEASLFAGDLGWLDRTRALVVETHDWLFPGQATSRALFAAISARSFDFVASGENVLLFRT